MRELRSYRRIAHLSHFCDRCCGYIQPGEEYEGRVCATPKHIIVMKEHINPACEWPTEPEDEREKHEERDSDLPMAA